MFMKTVLADGQAEQQVIREMKARAAGARGDIEQIVRGVMADVQQRGWDAVVEYAERFDGKAPYIVEPKVLDDAYNACDPKLIAALEKAAANIRDYHEQMLVKTWEWNRSKGETLGSQEAGVRHGRYRHDRRPVRGAGHCRSHRQPDLRCRRPAQSGRARQAGFRRPADRFHGAGAGDFVRDGAAGKAPPAVGHHQGERGELRLRHRV